MACSASVPPGQPGPTERWRLVQWLRLLDALDENIAPRDLAATLILPDAGSYSAAEWDASSERRRLARWQRSAIAMRDGGYLALLRSEEHTSELQSLMRISYAVFCLK